MTLKLTKAQTEELRRLEQKPQRIYGSGRTRVHNNLVMKGLADWGDEVGQPLPRITRRVDFRRGEVAERCVITQAGRLWLAGRLCHGCWSGEIVGDGTEVRTGKKCELCSRCLLHAARAPGPPGRDEDEDHAR